MKRLCFALDLKDDPQLIVEYEKYHQAVWPEIISSIKDAGIEKLDIYRVGNRLFMVMEVNDHFNLAIKAKADAVNPFVQKWETLMWNYQQALPFAQPNEKWLLMEQIFKL